MFLSFLQKQEYGEKTGCRIKSGMTYFDIFTCRTNKFEGWKKYDYG